MSDPAAYVSKGWHHVLDDLDQPGRRWIISPWVTPAQSSFSWRFGDRLIIRGKARDFVQGSSSLGVVEEALAKGAEVRRSYDLHAKIYALERPSGEGLVWLGSANFTRRGYQGESNNIEAVAGPFALIGEVARGLKRIWDQASPVNLTLLQTEIERYKVREADILALARTNTLALRVAFKYGQGHCTFRPEWLGIDPDAKPWTSVTFPAIDYFSSDTDMVKGWRNLREKELRAIQKLGLARIEGGLGNEFYLLAFSQRPQIQAALEQARQRIRKQVERDVKGSVASLREDFGKRFETVVEHFWYEKSGSEMHNTLTKVDRKKALAAALTRFDDYVASGPADLGYSFFIPLHDGASDGSGVSRAAEALLSQPQLDF